MSDGTVFYTAGSRQSQMTIVLIQDCDIPAFSGFISSQDNLYRKTDTLWERYDDRLESGCGNTERLTIDLEKKYIKYQFVVY